MLVRFQKTVLENGLRVITEEIKDFPTVSVGFWLNVGSRDEAPEEAGLTHFIEHMLFKGTERRSALQIAKEMDRLGGYSNAFTAREQTCFHGKVLPEDIPRLVDLLADLLLNPRFDVQDIEREKQVILQEIKMVEDSPEELVHEIFGTYLWDGASLGRSILGDWDTVARFDREALISYYNRFYGAQNLIIAAVGNIRHEEFLDLLKDYLSKFKKGAAPKRKRPKGRGGLKVVRRSLEQVHLVLGVPTPGAKDEARYAALLFNTLLGGNMSSRLFQEIREKRGLAYAIYSFLSLYEDVGALGVYAAVEKAKLKEALTIIAAEINSLARGEFRQDEMAAALDHLKSALLLSSDNPDTRMSRISRNEILYARYIPYEETLNRIKALTAPEVASFAQKIFATKPALVLLGPVEEEEVLFFYDLFRD